MNSGASAKLAVVSTDSNHDLFDAKQQIRSTHTSELVIALCGPIGAPLRRVGEAIKARLKSDFDYDPCEILRLSEFIETHTEPIVASSEFSRVKALIQQGDDLRKKYGASVLAELAVSKIVLDRQKYKEDSYAQRFMPRRVCHIIDSIKNQQELEILQLVYRDMIYFVGVYAPLPARVKTLEARGMTLAQIYELIDQDSGEELDHGQTVRDTFPNADFFLRVDTDTDTQISARVERFLHLILGTKIVTPTYAEKAMYFAASAAGNSACLSRQVGAALTDRSGEVISVGWNDVPKFGGTLYTTDHMHDLNGDKDKRCWNMDGGVCFNDREKNLLSSMIVSELVSRGLVQEKDRARAEHSVLSNSKLKGLIEFSRAIHAEMHALLMAGKLGGDRTTGGKIFITTYPCHSCARHIIAAGIIEVYYIEPYRKSLATKLHSDSITEDESDNTRVKLLPYDGVAPTKYLKLFKVPKDSRKSSGKMIKVDPKKAEPRFDKTLEALPALEALVVRGLKEKKLVPAEGPNG